MPSNLEERFKNLIFERRCRGKMKRGVGFVTSCWLAKFLAARERKRFGLLGGFVSLIVFLGVVFPASFVFGQEWSKTFGGSSWDKVRALQQTRDGGYIVAGNTFSFGAGGYDVWVLKLSADGSVEWQKTYGGRDNDFINAIRQTRDGGYIMAGYTSSFGAFGSRDHDAWVLKLSANGEVEWQKTYGWGVVLNYDVSDVANDIWETTDGGYIVVGTTDYIGLHNDVTPGDIWVLKLSRDGEIEWHNIYRRGDGDDTATAVQQTRDGGYIVTGYVGYKFFVLKLKNKGEVEWWKSYEEGNMSFARAIQQTRDGGYIVTGYVDNLGGGGSNIWVLKLSADGSVEWQKAYSRDVPESEGIHNEHAYAIQQTRDGGYIVAGDDGSSLWLLKLSENGTVEWWRTSIGGDCRTSGYFDIARTVQQTRDGGYIVAGNTRCVGAGDDDFWILKLSADGYIPDCYVIGGISSPSLIKKTVLVTDTNTPVRDIDGTVISPPKSHVANDIQVTVSSPHYEENTQCYAAASQYTLTVSLTGTGNGTVTSDPAGISCPDTCSARFDNGTQVTLTATADDSFAFTGWGGACAPCGKDTSCQITMDNDKTCTASFNSAPSKGDVNGDNQINILDALVVARCALNLSGADCDPQSADVNCDHQINILDALLIARKALGLPVPPWCTS